MDKLPIKDQPINETTVLLVHVLKLKRLVETIALF